MTTTVRFKRNLILASLVALTILFTNILPAPTHATDDIHKELNGDWRYWGTGSDNGFDNGRAYVGWCLALAYNKILIESGARTPDYIPPNFEKDLNGRGLYIGGDGWCGFDSPDIVKMSKGKLSLFEQGQYSVSGLSPSEKKKRFMDWIDQDCYLIVERSGHFYAISHDLSVLMGEPYKMDGFAAGSHADRLRMSIGALSDTDYNEIYSVRVFKGTDKLPRQFDLDQMLSTISIDSLSHKGASIHARFRQPEQLTEYGCFIGTSASNMKRVSDRAPLEAIDHLDLDLAESFGELEPDTTYIYQLYAISHGEVLKSPARTLTTWKDGSIPTSSVVSAGSASDKADTAPTATRSSSQASMTADETSSNQDSTTASSFSSTAGAAEHRSTAVLTSGESVLDKENVPSMPHSTYRSKLNEKRKTAASSRSVSGDPDAK